MVRFETRFDYSKSATINNRNIKKILPFMIVISILFEIYAFVFIGFDDLIGLIACAIGGLCLIPLWLLLCKRSSKKIDSSLQIMSLDTIQTFEFFEDRFIVKNAKGDEFSETFEMKYTLLYKVVKTKDNYFLYISKAQVHIVPVTSLVEGTLDELDMILKSYIPQKFQEK